MNKMGGKKHKDRKCKTTNDLSKNPKPWQLLLPFVFAPIHGFLQGFLWQEHNIWATLLLLPVMLNWVQNRCYSDSPLSLQVQSGITRQDRTGRLWLVRMLTSVDISYVDWKVFECWSLKLFHTEPIILSWWETYFIQPLWFGSKSYSSRSSTRRKPSLRFLSYHLPLD